MTYVGMWLDHKKAIVVKRTQNQEFSKKIHSGLSPLNKAKHCPRAAPKKQEERRAHIITQFYHDVLSAIEGADKVFLMGPGLAKKEFKIFLGKQGFSGRIVAVTDADKMTDPQVSAQTRNFFNLGIGPTNA